MCRITHFLILLITACGTLSARIGETEKNLVERYGEVTLRMKERAGPRGNRTILGDQLSFQSEPFRVRAVLIDGRCEKIRYEKTGEWSDEEINSLLELNASDQSWKRVESRFRVARREWARDDGAKAIWSSSLSMTFTTPTFQAALEAAEGPEDGGEK